MSGHETLSLFYLPILPFKKVFGYQITNLIIKYKMVLNESITSWYGLFVLYSKDLYLNFEENMMKFKNRITLLNRDSFDIG